MAQYWGEIGIQATTDVVSRELHQERRLARDFDIFLWSGPAGGTVGSLTRPGNYIPMDTSSANAWAQSFAEWYLSGGEEGEEPPAEIKEVLELYTEVTQTADPERQSELMGQILDSYAQNLWTFGIAPPSAGARRGQEQHAQRAGRDAGRHLLPRPLHAGDVVL